MAVTLKIRQASKIIPLNVGTCQLQTSTEPAPNIAATFVTLYRHNRDSRVLLRWRRNFEICEHNGRKYVVQGVDECANTFANQTGD